MRVLTLADLLLLISGCTNFYKPVSSWEQSVFDQSRFDVYPDDVRKDFDSLKGMRLAWAGTIDEVAIDTTIQPALMHLVVAHHFSRGTLPERRVSIGFPLREGASS